MPSHAVAFSFDVEDWFHSEFVPPAERRAHPESVVPTRALAPACALPIMSAEEDGPLRMIGAEVIVTSSSLGIVVDGSPPGWAGAEGWLAIDGEASFTGGSALGT